MSEWQPIETVDKRKEVLGYDGEEMAVVEYDPESGMWTDGCDLYVVSHWMPLPEPPNE